MIHLKNRHKGERCVLVCNGPSLNKMELDFLKNEYVVGLNKIYLGFKKFRFYPNYFVAVNAKVLTQSESEIKKLSSVKFLSDRCPDVYKENALTHILKTKDYQGDFSHDIRTGVQEGYTVTYAALQVAYYLGFNEVIIIGMDHKFDFEGEPNEAKLMEGNDTNHFSTEYFKGHSWDNPDLINSERYYKIAKDRFEEHGRRIFDATIDGNCSVFEKVDYKNIFGLK